MANKYESMTMKELLEEYNLMVNEIQEKFPEGAISWARSVQRFSSVEVGAQRCLKLQSSMKAFKQGPKEEAEPESEPKKKLKQESKQIKSSATPKNKKPDAEPKDQYLTDWGLREGTNVARLVKMLLDNIDKEFKVEDIVNFIYGSHDAKGINNVINNVKTHIKKTDRPYTLVTSKRMLKLIDKEG